MGIKQLTLATLFFSTSINSWAVEWTTIITKPDYEILVDIDSYNTAEGLPYILTKTVFNAPQTLVQDTSKVSYASSIQHTQFNCRQPQYKVISTTFYQTNNKEVATKAAQPAFTAIAEGSDEFSVGQLVCQVHRMVGGQ